MTEEKDNKENAPESAERREALAKLGKMALFVPPTMATLLITDKASAASLGPPPPPP